uniref:Uncharacterized protein n=1 Tax=Odontella aurita TaxID=265563 RepID=A0A7S4I9E9_9STRA|mmetsp:Transcript_21734/g.63988  ORF Transcript_21734/g.63988 Transcript_21734/m.63988 type:complete len:179 (+) Transcript_21734:310-846(+)
MSEANNQGGNDGAEHRCNGDPSRFSPDRAHSIIPSGEVLGFIRALLGRYPPTFAVRCIGILLERSPYPFIEPLLLDLLRPTLVPPAMWCSSAEKDDGNDAGEGDAAAREVLSIAAPYLERMGRHCKVVGRRSQPPRGRRGSPQFRGGVHVCRGPSSSCGGAPAAESAARREGYVRRGR